MTNTNKNRKEENTLIKGGNAPIKVGFMDAKNEVIEIVPAILCQTRADLAIKLSQAAKCPILQIDLMDGKFVNNKTVGAESMDIIPHDKIVEYHLMVSDPAAWIKALPGGKRSIFQVHIESVKQKDIPALRELVQSKKSTLAWAISPHTDIARLYENMQGIDYVLVMTVVPGFSGQKYMKEMEPRIKEIRSKYPEIIIEIDGGAGKETMMGAIDAGASRVALASALFSQQNVAAAYDELKRIANKR